VREFSGGQNDGRLEVLCELYIVCTALCGVEVRYEGVQGRTELR